MHSSGMCTACLLTVYLSISGGRSAHPPGGRPPWMQTPLDADPPGHVTCDACWEANHPPFPVNRIIDACENITLPQTSFVGGNKVWTTIPS